MLPILSVVIPTLNRYNDLKNTIRDLERQKFEDFEIIIVDQTSNPIRSHFDGLNVRYFWSTECSASAARNIGIREARGEYILFLDDDIIISNEYFISNHLRHYQDPSVPGVVGCIMEPDGIKRMDRHKWSYKRNVGWLFFPRNYGLPALVECGGSGNLSVRRSFAIEAGGMDENYIKGAHREESDFCLRVVRLFGLFVYDPDADIIHIGAASGGIRTWVSSRTIVKQQQHFDGNSYFLVKNFQFKTFPYHLIATFFFFFYNKKLLYRPFLIVLSAYRMFLSLIFAFKNFRHPKYLKV